jgi:hypothetical protein
MAALIVLVVSLLAFSGATTLPPPNISNLRQRTRP